MSMEGWKLEKKIFESETWRNILDEITFRGMQEGCSQREIREELKALREEVRAHLVTFEPFPSSSALSDLNGKLASLARKKERQAKREETKQ